MIEGEEMSSAPPGSQAFLGSLQDATTKLWKWLSEADQLIYAKLAKKWLDEAPPPNIQSRYSSTEAIHLGPLFIQAYAQNGQLHAVQNCP
jgi:hypothetical protein